MSCHHERAYGRGGAGMEGHLLAFASVAIGPALHLVRCSDMSGVEVEANSKSMAAFGRE